MDTLNTVLCAHSWQEHTTLADMIDSAAIGGICRRNLDFVWLAYSRTTRSSTTASTS